MFIFAYTRIKATRVIRFFDKSRWDKSIARAICSEIVLVRGRRDGDWNRRTRRAGRNDKNVGVFFVPIVETPLHPPSHVALASFLFFLPFSPLCSFQRVETPWSNFCGRWCGKLDSSLGWYESSTSSNSNSRNSYGDNSNRIDSFLL